VRHGEVQWNNVKKWVLDAVSDGVGELTGKQESRTLHRRQSVK
jgi:hypothetical protein